MTSFRERIEEYLRESESKLNPLIFEGDKLKQEVKSKVLEIVDEFVEYAQVESIDILDIRLVGSNAAYNYTPTSDLDIHIIVDISKISEPEIIGRLYFDSIKSQFKDKYDITIKGIEVEIYVEDINSSSVSNGVYSVVRDKWIKEPVDVGDPEESETNRAKDMVTSIMNSIEDTDSIEDLQDIVDSIYLIRKDSLASKGEYGAGNLAFKMLRSEGVLDAVKDTLSKAKSKELSLESKSITESTINPLRTLKGSVIKRSPKYGVGKEIGGQIYVHKNYANMVAPEGIRVKAEMILEEKKPDFKYNCIMYDTRKPESIRFDEAPDFDTAREPTPGNMISVNTETGDIIERKSAQIWHHKWLWVLEDYTGFDVQESYEWSKTWLEKISHPSGYRDKWEKELRDVGLIESLVHLEENSLDDQYKEYITNHRAGVSKVFEEVMRPILLEEGIDEEMLSKIDDLIENHDMSKFDDYEFSAYRDRFYKYKDHEELPEDVASNFDVAWNHHQKSNPHHWNYWVLINDVDEPQTHALDMPFEYVIEMLCDWQSAGKFYGNSAKDWYEKNGKKMILSDNTRNLIERYIDNLT